MKEYGFHSGTRPERREATAYMRQGRYCWMGSSIGLCGGPGNWPASACFQGRKSMTMSAGDMMRPAKTGQQKTQAVSTMSERRPVLKNARLGPRGPL